MLVWATLSHFKVQGVQTKGVLRNLEKCPHKSTPSHTIITIKDEKWIEMAYPPLALLPPSGQCGCSDQRSLQASNVFSLLVKLDSKIQIDPARLETMDLF